MAASKKPAFQFYPGDWMKDADLRRCTPSARGVWMDLICLAHECRDRGKFSTNGAAWPLEDLGRALSGDLCDNLCALRELLEKGVLKQQQDGVYFVERIVRDEAKSRLCSQAGKAGGGNPEWKSKGDCKGDGKGAPKGTRKRNTKASSSSSTSVLLSTIVESRGLPGWILDEPFQAAWKDWETHRAEIKHALKPTTINEQIVYLAPMGQDIAIATIRKSIRHGWQGLFADEKQAATSNHTTSSQNALERTPEALEATYQKMFGDSADDAS